MSITDSQLLARIATCGGAAYLLERPEAVQYGCAIPYAGAWYFILGDELEAILEAAPCYHLEVRAAELNVSRILLCLDLEEALQRIEAWGRGRQEQLVGPALERQ